MSATSLIDAPPAVEAIPRSRAAHPGFWVPISLFFMIRLVMAIDTFMLGSLVTPIKESFHISDKEVGAIGFVTVLALLVGSPLMGLLADRFARKALIVGALLLWSGATFSSGLAPSIGFLLVCRALVGFASGSYDPTATSWQADLFPPKWRALFFAGIQVAGNIGCCIGFLFGGYFSQAYGWNKAFFVAGIPCLALAVAFLFLREPARGHADGHDSYERPSWRDTLSLLTNHRFLLYVLTIAATCSALHAVVQWAPAFLHRYYDLSNRDASYFVGLGYLVTGIPGIWLGGYTASLLRRRIPYANALQLTGILLVGGVLQLVVFTTEDKTVALTTLWIEMFFSSATFGAWGAILIELVAVNLRSSAFALQTIVAYSIGGFLASMVIGALSDRYGLRTGLLVGPASFFIASGLSLALVLLERAGLRRGQPLETVGAPLPVNPVI